MSNINSAQLDQVTGGVPVPGGARVASHFLNGLWAWGMGAAGAAGFWANKELVYKDNADFRAATKK